MSSTAGLFNNYVLHCLADSFHAVFGRSKAVDIHHGILRADVVAEAVEMFAFQLCFRHAVIFGCNLFKNSNGFLAGRAAEYKIVIAETGDVAFLFMRGRNSAFGSNKAEFFSVLAGDDSCCFQVADNNLFVFAARNGVCAGLGNNFFNREAAVNNFGDTEDVMSAGACNLIFGQRGLVFVPL